jgi:hypothetical protein
MSKAARRVLGALNTASLIMAGSLPLMANADKTGTAAGSKGKTSQKVAKDAKPKILDKKGSKSCGADGKSCSGAGSKQKK